MTRGSYQLLSGFFLNSTHIKHGMPEEIDSEKMQEIQNSDEAWVVDFWAEWCGPCRKMAPLFEELDDEMSDVKFGKVDMEAEQDVGVSAGVRALPTFLVYVDGEEVARKAGAMNKDQLKQFIEDAISG